MKESLFNIKSCYSKRTDTFVLYNFSAENNNILENPMNFEAFGAYCQRELSDFNLS